MFMGFLRVDYLMLKLVCKHYRLYQVDVKFKL